LQVLLLVLVAIPLSAVVGVLVGGIVCVRIYYANHYFRSTKALTVFTVALFITLSTGLFTGGCHNFEKIYGYTPTVYVIEGDFWSIDCLPMTIFKPFGLGDTRTVLQICCFWTWLFFSLILHYFQNKKCKKPPSACTNDVTATLAVDVESQNTTEEENIAGKTPVDAPDAKNDFSTSLQGETREPSESDNDDDSLTDNELEKKSIETSEA